MTTDLPLPDDLAALWGSAQPRERPLRVIGLFAHPDDEVFCVGGTFARASASGAETAIVSLTQGEAGEIRDSVAATRRTLGATRAKELNASAAALGSAARSASISATASWPSYRSRSWPRRYARFSAVRP